MNRKQRKEIKELTQRLIQTHEELMDILGEEETKLENMPENLQGSYKYSKLEDEKDELEEGVDELEQVIESLSQIADR